MKVVPICNNAIYVLKKDKNGKIKIEYSEGTIVEKYDIKINSYLEDVVNKILSKNDYFTIKNYFDDAFNGNSTAFVIESNNSLFYNLVNPIYADNKVEGVIGFIIDITNHINIEAKIIRMAYFDDITGLPNRTMFKERFEEEIIKNKNKKLAIMFIDLNKFKMINDTMGHDAGDELLKLVSLRLQECFIETKSLLARIGGDEFVLLLKNIETKEEIKDTVNTIFSALDEPFLIMNKEFKISISIGISVYPDDETEINKLLKKADYAMYKVKKDNTNNYYFFNDNY